MNTTIFRTVIVAAAVPVVLIALPGTAGAAAPAVEGGRARVQVTANLTGGEFQCRTQLDGGSFSSGFGGAGQPASVLFENVAVGNHSVKTLCFRPGPDNIYTTPVTVTAPNPVLDAIDGVLAGAGSSALTTDPTLR